MEKKSSSSQVLWAFLLLTIIIAVPYFSVSTFDYIGYDDDAYVVQNTNVVTGLTVDNVIWAFTTSHSANWHPLTWISHMIDCELFGLKPGAHHWMSLNFHILNTLLLFFILYRMTHSIKKSFFVAVFFGIHPLHVESVAWVAERKDVLSTFMALISICFYVQYVFVKKLRFYWLAVLFFAMSLMAKPMMVTLPFLLCLLDFWPLSRKQLTVKLLIVEKIPFFILTVISCFVTIWAQQKFGAIQSLESLPLIIRIENALASYGWYVYKMMIPTNIAIFYPHPENHLSWVKILWGTFFICFGFFASWRFRTSCPYIIFGFLWFVGSLVPVIGFVQVGLQAYADRYSYVPLIGLFIVFIWGSSDLMKNLKINDNAILCLFVLIMLYLTVLCTFQVNVWKNGRTVFEHALKVIPDNYVAMTHLGTTYYLTKAISIQPEYIPALYNLGTVLIHDGKPDEALKYYLKAVNLQAKHPDLFNNIGAIYYQRKQYQKARDYFQKAIGISPYHKNARKNLDQVNKLLPK